jgi:site-specific DNA-methyltransferase (adenine-specific)
LVFDPFGGSGTTFAAAELTGRRWIGSEIDCSAIVQRFANIDADRQHLEEIHANKNTLFTRADLARRRKRGVTPLSNEYRLNGDECLCLDERERDQMSLFDAVV